MLKVALLILIGLLMAISFVSAANLIVKQPRDTVICKAIKTATFTVTANPSYEVAYQWYRGNSAIPNATGDSYMAQQEGSYHCVVWDINMPANKESSNVVTLSYIDIPSIGSINAPGVCNKTNLIAEAVNVKNNGSAITGYEWVLGGNIVGSGTGSTIDKLDTYVDSTMQLATLTLNVMNSCGVGSSSMQITVNPTPVAPNVISKDYCQYDQATPLAITQSNATWYTSSTGGTGSKVAPTPDTDTLGTYNWWVTQTINYGDVSCEGYRTKATVVVTPRSDAPVTDVVPKYCVGDTKTLEAQGDNIKWYSSSMVPLVDTRIPTSSAGEQVYYVTQTQAGKCESKPVKVTVTIQNNANEALITLSGIPEAACPYNPIIIEATANVSNPVFTWYENDDKTGFIQTGSTYTTNPLTANATYYVTLTYTGHCESQPKAAVIIVSDNVRPAIIAPPTVVAPTNDGVCYATNVQTGTPVVADNCTPHDQIVIFVDPSLSLYKLGSTTLTWWAEDLMGNKDYALQTVTVQDQEAPKGYCPEDIIMEVNDDVDSVVVNYILNYSDNCGNIDIVRESGKASGSYFPLGTTIVRHSISDSTGNVAICEFKVIIRHPYRAMELALRVSAYEICSGQAVTLTPIVSGGTEKYTYSWSPRPWTNAVLEDYPLVTTTYEVTVNDGISSLSKSVEITVLETQPVKLTIDKRMDEILEGDEVVVKATSGFASYKFLLNDKVMQEVGVSDQIAFIAELGTYFVRVFATDVDYCVSQDQLEIDVESKKLPNVFTPNQDGKNEIFLEGYDLKVFSRAGELLYQGTAGWDGRYKGKMLPQGTYLYVVTRTMNNGEHRIYKGTVTLKL